MRDPGSSEERGRARRSGVRRAAFAGACLVLAAACRSVADEARLELAALERDRVGDPGRYEPSLLRGDAQLRAAAARAAGRVRDPALAPAVARALRVESDPAVRAEQLFALGQLGNREAAQDGVLPWLQDRDPPVRARAAEALGKLGPPEFAPNLVARLADPEPQVRGAALLALARLVGRRAGAGRPLDGAVASTLALVLPSLVADADPAVAWKAAYATAEIECAGRLPAALAAADSPVAEARFFAAAALGRIGEEPAVRAERLIALLDDADVFVAAQAAAALARSFAPAGADEGETGERARAALLRAAASDARASDHHLRRAALAALGARAGMGGAWRDAAASAAERGARDATLLVRAEAWRVQALLGEATALAGLVRRAVAEGDAHERVAAVRALAAVPAAGEAAPDTAAALVRLAHARDAYVASEALAALAARPPAADDAAARATLRELALDRGRSGDPAVAASAIDLLRAAGAAEDLGAIEAAFARLHGEEMAEARVNALRAAAGLAGEAALALLARGARDAAPAVRTAAREELAKLPGEAAKAALVAAAAAPAPAAAPVTVGLRAGELLDPGGNPRVRLEFARGAIVVELLADAAPHHAKLFRERVARRRCDGLPIHRIVTGFVVQGFDPRGDGWGTGGVVVRDEIHPVPYERGVVGMPNAGPDSGGCQLFAMLMPAPHLDGRYTVYGRVIEGLDVLDALDLGERCLRAEIVE